MARSQVYQFDSAAIYKKTIFDFINDIRPCGGVTETAPFMGIKTNGVGGETGPLGWQLVLPYLIAIHYRHYGNVNLLAESLPFLEKQILSLEMRDFDDLVTCCLGDWEAAFMICVITKMARQLSISPVLVSIIIIC